MAKRDWRRSRAREIGRLTCQQEADAWRHVRELGGSPFSRSTMKDIRCACGHRAAVTVPTRVVRLRCSGCQAMLVIDATIPG